MRKIKLYIATSMDGYIARENGDVSWLHEFEPVENEDFGYQLLYDSIDATLMGNATYREILGFGIPFPYTDKLNYVFSQKDHGTDENVRFVNDDIVDFTHTLKKQPGKDIWLVGGSQINTLLMNQLLIDEIILTITPIVLGQGIPLFTSELKEHKLKLIHSQMYSNGFVKLVYN